MYYIYALCNVSIYFEKKKKTCKSLWTKSRSEIHTYSTSHIHTQTLSILIKWTLKGRLLHCFRSAKFFTFTQCVNALQFVAMIIRICAITELPLHTDISILCAKKSNGACLKEPPSSNSAHLSRLETRTSEIQNGIAIFVFPKRQKHCVTVPHSR
jgi:hypothetical protein